MKPLSVVITILVLFFSILTAHSQHNKPAGSGVSSTGPPPPPPLDPQEKTVNVLPPFKTLTAGTQTWRVENLNVESFCNGDPIPEAKNDEAWKAAAAGGKPAWCFYRNDPSNSGEYGRLYNWYAVNDPRGLAPLGWHIPAMEEWDAFESVRKSDPKQSAEQPFPGISRSYNGTFGNLEDRPAWWSSSGNTNTGSYVHVAGSAVAGPENVTASKGTGYPVWLIRSDVDHPGWKTVHAGRYLWMAENLRVMVFSNGDPIPVVTDLAAWDSIGKTGKPACTLVETGNTSTILYNWYAVKDPRKLAPVGWHIPTKDEWKALIDTLGPGQGGALLLKEGKFNAGSTGLLQQGVVMHEDKMAAWWTATAMTNEIGWAAIASYVLRNDVIIQGFDKKYGLTIRLVRDKPVPEH